VPLPDNSTVIPIGIKISADGNYTIKSSSLIGLEDYNVYLKDLQQNITINLKEIPEYSFAAVIGTTTSRFTIDFSDLTTGTEDNELTGKDFNVYSAFNMLNIQTLVDDWNGKSCSVKLLYLTGKTINDLYNIEFSKSSVTQIPAPNKTGMYIVEIKSGVKRFVSKVVIK
jgi:hypothetical protein